MKCFLISDNVDTQTGMRLAGVDGVVVHERAELKAALEGVLKDKEIGIVLLTEKFGREFPEIIDDIKLNRKLPLIVEIPDQMCIRDRPGSSELPEKPGDQCDPCDLHYFRIGHQMDDQHPDRHHRIRLHAV